MTLKSRLSKRLEAEIAAARSPVQQVGLKAQRALLLARHGEMNEAREQLTQLHQLAFQHPHPEIGAWLHFAEGLMSYYSDPSSAAHERIQRGLDIALSAKIAPLAALCSAWLAQLAYIRHELTTMIEHAQACDEQAAPDHHAARYRLCTVLGLAHHFAGGVAIAQAWYGKARAHAAAEGDEAGLSALMYNMAEMHNAQLRRESLLGNAAADGSIRRLGADSIERYDEAVGVAMNPEMSPIMRAQILTVEGDFAQAQALFEAHLPKAMSGSLVRRAGSLLADLAWCRANTGQAEQALHQAREVEIELDPRADVDDRAAAYSRLAQVYAKLGDAAAAERNGALASTHWQEFANQQRVWAQALTEAGLQPR